jgi:hypothetical protein
MHPAAHSPADETPTDRTGERDMFRSLPLSLAAIAIVATTAMADPGITVRWQDDLLRVTLDGSYAGAWYQVWRADGAAATFSPLQPQLSLCTGDCFLTDVQALPGQTYWYRFDLQPPSGGTVTYGPYAVTVPDTPLGAVVSPNPSRAGVRVDVSLPGSRRLDSPLPADVRVLDVAGRTVRVLGAGPLARGVTSFAWDGRATDGRAVRAGLYFVRVAIPSGVTTTRLVRFQ